MHGWMGGGARLLLLTSPVQLENLLFPAYANNCYLALSLLFSICFYSMGRKEMCSTTYYMNLSSWRWFFCFFATTHSHNQKEKGFGTNESNGKRGHLFWCSLPRRIGRITLAFAFVLRHVCVHKSIIPVGRRRRNSKGHKRDENGTRRQRCPSIPFGGNRHLDGCLLAKLKPKGVSVFKRSFCYAFFFFLVLLLNKPMPHWK